MMKIARGIDAPRHLMLGAWGFTTVVKRLQQRLQDITVLRERSLAGDFDDGA